MPQSVLSRYLDPVVLSRLAEQGVEPHGLVIGTLAGAHKSPLSGFAVEFAGHREYVAGDDPKHLDWRLFFTRDKYFIKQYEMETNFVCHLLLDVSASMRYGEEREQKLLYASQMAAVLAYSIVRRNDKVSLATFDNVVRGFVPPGNSLPQILRITEHLDGVAPVQKTNMADCLMELAGRMRRREIVMIFSDFLADLDSLEPSLQRMRYNKHDVVLFQVLHHEERTFEFQGMVKFVGIEEESDLIAQTEEIRRGYLQALQEHQQRLEEICRRNRIELVPVDTSRPQAEVLVDYLQKRETRRTR